MTDLTRKAIKEAFIVLLNERPLNRITVRDIVEACGINRNTFYYHFGDISCLIEEIVKEDAESVMKKYPPLSSVAECFDALMEFASMRKNAVMHIYRSVSRDMFEFHLSRVCEYLITGYIGNVLRDEDVSEDAKEASIYYYKSLCMGLVLGWLAEGMPEKRLATVREIFELQKERELEIARKLRPGG